MRPIKRAGQQGAALFVALIMLLVITVLAVSSLKSVALESRIVANRQITQSLINAADAAVREGEFRFYGLGYVREKLEPDEDNNCDATKNKLRSFNKPCLLAVNYNETEDLIDVVKRPAKEAVWMTYQGLDKEVSKTTMKTGFEAGLHSIRIQSGEEVSESINPEYGAMAIGKGTCYYLVNGKSEFESKNSIVVQTTVAIILDGINN